MKRWFLGSLALVLLLCNFTYGDAGSSSGRKTLIDDFEIAPNVTLVGFLSPFRLGVEVRYQKEFELGFDYGWLPKFYMQILGANTDEVSDAFSLKTYTFSVKYYPWQGAFYVGFMAGKLNFSTPLSAVPTLNGNASYLLDADISQFFVGPMLGWRWVIFEGLFAGLDLGYQFKVSSSGSYHVALGPTATTSDLDEAMDRIQTASLPMITLLKIGYRF